MNLSTHFTLDEACFSSTALRCGIDNTPNQDVVTQMLDAANGMEQVRALLRGLPIHIDSWYRSHDLNIAVGGANNSAHMLGYAVDFICPQFGTPLEIVRTIVRSAIQFDQCIEEGRWVHISFAPAMRRKALTATFINGVAHYSEGVA